MNEELSRVLQKLRNPSALLDINSHEIERAVTGNYQLSTISQSTTKDTFMPQLDKWLTHAQAEQPAKILAHILVMIEASDDFRVDEYEAFERACQGHAVSSVGLMLRNDFQEDQLMVSALMCFVNAD